MNQTDDRKTCTLCNRKFSQDRLAKHIEICKKQKEKKRKVFDSYKQRQILDDEAENKNESKPTDQPAGKSRTRIVKPVSRPAVKPANRSKAAENKKIDNKKTETNETNEWPKNKTTNGATTNGTNGATKTTKPNPTQNPTQNGSSNGKVTGQAVGGQSDSADDNQGNRKATNGKKSQWRENHEEFVRSIQAAKGSLESSDESAGTHKPNGHELADKESTITTNSESTSNTTASSTATINLTAATTNERMQHPDGEEPVERPKPAPRKIQPPQSRLSKGKLAANPANAQQLTNGNAKQVNGQAMMNGNSTGSGSAHSSSSNGTGQASTPATTKKSMNSVECPTCGRSFNRAAGERHITFCAEQQRQRKSSSNVNNEEALARFRARNAYRSTKAVIRKRDKSVPNEKKEKYVRQSSLRRALSTIDGLDQVFNGHSKEPMNGSSSSLRKRSTSQGNLNRGAPKYGQPAKRLQISTAAHSKSSSASSKGSAQNYNNPSAGYRETAQSRVKARLNQQQRLQKQRMNSNYPKTPIMKFKEKFPNHNNKLIEFADSQQFSQMFKHLNNSIELNNLPKTVPGVRTGGLSPTKDIHRNGHHIDDLNDLEQLRAKIKEMYLSSNGNHSQGDLINLDYHLAGSDFNETSFTRENSSKLKSSKSVNDFLALNDGFSDHLMNDLELPRACHQCSTQFITSLARYCYSCGARRLGTVNSFLV